MYKKQLPLFLLIPFLASCANLSVNSQRADYYKEINQQKIQRTSALRASTISEMNTVYSDSIACVGEYLAKYQNMTSYDYSQFGGHAFNLSSKQNIPQLNLEKNRLEQERRKKRERHQFLLIRNTFLANEKHPLKHLIEIASGNVEYKELEEEIAELNKKIQSIEEQIAASKQSETKIKNALNDYIQGSSWQSYSVSPIYDKTGKVFASDSSAISDMVSHALTYNSAIRFIDTPFNSDSTFSRANVISTSNQSIGSVFKADRYINGALVQFDEGTPLSNLSLAESAKLSIDPVDISNGTKILTVGIVLRMLNSKGEMIFTGFNDIQTISDGQGFNVKLNNVIDYSPASIYLQNTFFVKQVSADIFEISSKRGYGFNISFSTSDPKTFAVREMVERGIYELFLRSLPNIEKKHTHELTLNLRKQARESCSPKFEELTQPLEMEGDTDET